MEPPTPAQLLEPFRLFCNEGRKISKFTSLKETQEDKEERREACKELYEALASTFIEFDASDVPPKNLSPHLITLLGCFIADDEEEVVTKRHSPSIKS